MKIKQVDFTESSLNDLKKLSPNIKKEAKARLDKLLDNPRPSKLRFEKLSGYKNPNIYTIHLTPNHSHKASMRIENEVALILRIGTHKEIDRSPK